MNMNLNDPKLTAYALDELTGAEKAEMGKRDRVFFRGAGGRERTAPAYWQPAG
jgi:hypothetical protein